MALSHNQYAVAAIAATLCLAGLYTVVGAGLSSTDSGGFESAIEDVDLGSDGSPRECPPDVPTIGCDWDGDGIADRMENTLYGTNWQEADTDGDGLDDGWEIENGLDPLDTGEPCISIGEGLTEVECEDIQINSVDTEQETGEQNETFPNPDNGPLGDPDRDGLTNLDEAAIGTNPRLKDTDGDGLNDRWEAAHTHNVTTPSGVVTLLDPLDGNWNCPLLTPERQAEIRLDLGEDLWEEMGTQFGHSCDAILDLEQPEPDTLRNFVEERYDTNPLDEDSDGDLIDDRYEIAFGPVNLGVHCGRPVFGILTIDAPYTDLMSGTGDLTWFEQDMDGDGRLNGPSDWDSDGDGMPDGFEYCYNSLLNPANSTDAYGDNDDDGLNNIEEFEVSYTWGPSNFTDPLDPDTDNDGMPDGWEHQSGIHPNDGSNADEDPDFDGYDADGNGAVTYKDMVGASTIERIDVSPGDYVQVNRTILWVRTVVDSNYVNIPVKTETTGWVYHINVEPGDEVTSRLQNLVTVVEQHERFTNLDEYNARDRDGDGVVDGRSTDPLNADTDADGLIDGIEVIGWKIRIVDFGVREVIVRSDPGVFDTDKDGLSDSVEFYETFTNTTDKDTDNDGLEDYREAIDGHPWYDNGTLVYYFTNASAFDTDNDGLEDGEEVIDGRDLFVTHANNADTDNDGLNDGDEVLYIPRPWQGATNPLINDTDQDGQPDGWEMQVFSVQQNTNSHSLWISTSNWLPPGCESMSECGLGPGGWVWVNYVSGFSTSGDRNDDGVMDPRYFLHEMNLSGFTIPENGRWALDPSYGSPVDSIFDIDNDSLQNSLEAPDRWDTNPVDDDSDGDKLPDGWEVRFSEEALRLGLVDNNSLDALGSRGPMDPRMPDSDLDGINDGNEDLDDDGLNRTILMYRYCPGWDNPQDFECHIDPFGSGSGFYDDLENYTNFEEFQNGTNPIINDTDGDKWNDGSEVYHQDQDGDDMWAGWEYYFGYDPHDPSDAMVDSDGDGYVNKCESKWNTNPKDPTSFPSQGELCSNYD
ncbi:MAG: hypothetical protein VYD27_00960 [Candidatus Thermoplasmatota archaeon]|nr:hypothetical protein [Candidatus Thermoplasmatota archaeon]